MRRREFIALIGSAAALPLFRVLVARAQEPARTYRLGILTGVARQATWMVAFFDELKVLGFVEGQNLKIVAGGFDLREDQMADVATTLAKAAPDVVLGIGDAAIRAAQQSASTVPIVALSTDLVASRSYVERLPMPIIGGIGVGEAITVQWPTGLHALLAFVEPDVLAERLMAEIDRIANTPCPLAEREQQIAGLEREIDRLQRTEEAIVVATGAPRERGCPPWVVLGVKAVEARGIRAA